MISTIVRAELNCDHGPGICLRQPTVIARETVFLVLNEARRLGWYIAGKECLCPKHAAEREADRRVLPMRPMQSASMASGRDDGRGSGG